MSQGRHFLTGRYFLLCPIKVNPLYLIVLPIRSRACEESLVVLLVNLRSLTWFDNGPSFIAEL